MISLPDWMHADTTITTDRQMPGRRRRVSFTRRALSGFSRLASDMLASDATASAPGLLQSIDPRAKMISLLGLVVISTFIHSIPILLACYGLYVILALLSRVGIRWFLKVWLAVPLFSAVIMLPAAFNVVTEGEPVLVLWSFARERFGPWNLPEILAVTDAGLLILARFVLRAAVCVSLVLLLAETTKSARLFRSLRALGVPKIFVMLLAVTQRYIDVLARSAREIHLAKMSRTIRSIGLRHEQAWVASGIGALYRRTRALGNEVYLAMLSRGYNGEIRLLDEPKPVFRDYAFTAFVAVFGAVLLMLGSV